MNFAALDPYRDDPPAVMHTEPGGGSESGGGGEVNTGGGVSSGGHVRENLRQSVSVCTCTNCPSSGIEENYKKCCHEVAGWQEEYNFTGLRQKSPI